MMILRGIKEAKLLAVGAAFATAFLGGCATTAVPQGPDVPAPLNVPAKAAQPEAELVFDGQGATPRATELRVSEDAPRAPNAGKPVVVGARDGDDIPPIPKTGPVAVNLEGVPVKVFANEILGNMLGLSVKIDPDVASLQELVTLNTSSRLSGREMYMMARQVLADYGVAVRQEGKVTRVSVAPSGSAVLPPLIISGRALPQVPISHRPVFQLVEMEAISVSDATRWLSTIFGSELKTTPDPTRNTLMLSGNPTVVRRALEALRVFDKPTMRGRMNARLQPAFVTAEQLASGLTDALNAQGYSASRSISAPASITVLSVPASNSVLLFASSQDLLDHAVGWAREIDRANPVAGEKSMFYYQVKNTRAEDVVAVLNGQQPGGSTGTTSGTPAAGAENMVAAGPLTAASPVGTQRPASGITNNSALSGGQLLVDMPRNALIFQGEPAQWERMLRIIRYIDRAPRQVMIEVTIAEVSLDDQFDFGVSWFAKAGFGRFGGKMTSGQINATTGNTGNTGTSSGSSGLTYLLDVAGQNRVALNAFAKDSRVTVLSRPHLLVKSGSEANIDVGTEVPTITMQTASNQSTNGSTNLLQAIQYRKTGLITRIKPTVFSDNRIDLEINQEASEVTASGPSIGGSPSIFNRSLGTSVVLRDGGSVVMAGLISETRSNGDGGIPIVKDIPLLGNLFKSTSKTRKRTELVIMIVPYIVDSDESANTISEAVVDSFDVLDIPLKRADTHPGPVPSAPLRNSAAPPYKLPARRVPATQPIR